MYRYQTIYEINITLSFLRLEMILGCSSSIGKVSLSKELLHYKVRLTSQQLVDIYIPWCACVFFPTNYGT
jgi:hypothetical protein